MTLAYIKKKKATQASNVSKRILFREIASSFTVTQG